MILDTVELIDIKRIVEEVIEEKFKKLSINEESNKPGLISRKETAKFLRISLPTLHDWTKHGMIKAYRIGNRVLYKQDDIENALTQIRSS